MGKGIRTAARRLRSIADRVRNTSPVAVWAVNLAALAASIAWVLADRDFPSSLLAFRNLQWDRLDWRSVALALLVIVIVGSFAALAVGFVCGSRRYRGIRALMAFATLVGLWLGTATNIENLAWQGKQLRLRPHLKQVERIAAVLRDDWPEEDSSLPQIGPFMGYPVGDVKTLLLLTPPKLARSGPAISVIERTDAGGLLFELSGRDVHDWLEWHPPGSRPDSRVGGLAEVLEMQRQVELGGGWYLVRYVEHTGRRVAAHRTRSVSALSNALLL